MNGQIAEKVKVPPPIPKRRRVGFVELRARLPLILRYFAILALIVTLFYVGTGYWRSRNNRDFIMFPGQPQLSNEVIAVVEGYERRVTEGDKLKMLVRADRETTYADGRHELDNIFLEVYPQNSEKPDRVTAIKAVYTPDKENPENYLVAFSGNVQFESRDSLKAQTEQIVYDKEKEVATTSSLINFSRDNVTGSAVGAVLNIRDKRLELQNQVEINVAPNGNLAKNSLTDFGSSAVRINSTRAEFDQDLAQLKLENGVQIIVSPQNTENSPTTIRAEKAVYEKDSEKLDLMGGVEIITASDNAGGIGFASDKAPASVPVTIRSAHASYEQGKGKIHLNGGSSIQQGNELMSGEVITADLSRQKKLQKVFTNGNAFLRTASGDRQTEVNAAEMNGEFDANQQINSAVAAGNIKIVSRNAENEIILSGSNKLLLSFQPRKDQSLLEKMRTEGDTNVSINALQNADYSQIQMFSPNFTEVFFTIGQDRSVLKQMQTGGRTTLVMSAPNSQNQNPQATNKKLIADTLKLFWNSSGKDLTRAEAVGNGELYVFPLAPSPNTDKQSLFAQRFDCDFFESGNLAKTFAASGGAKALLEPTAPSNERSTRTLTAEKMTAIFQRETQAVERFDAAGNAKFNEVDRNGVASNLSYTAGDEVVRLRGGEPTVWDSRARLKAAEIDWNTRSEISNLRGKVATTYYSQEQTGGATPFTKVNSPVFLTSNQAEFNYVTGTAVYQGNARAWQESNFVRAEKLILRRDSKSMFGEGRVQSALYNAKRRENGAQQVVPVFGASEKITFSDTQKLLRYETDVDIRQGTERITGGVAEVYLNAANEVERTLAQNSVVITQPGRKATGDWAQYTAADEAVVLRGNPAYVEDAEQGNSSGRQVTVYLRENRVIGQGGTNTNAPGRVRSTHKIKKQ